MRKWMLPALGLATALAFSAAPALADECDDKAAELQKALEQLPETSEVKQTLAGQIAEGLSRCKAGTNNPWEGVDPRINKM
jgi:hypothetical protein